MMQTTGAHGDKSLEDPAISACVVGERFRLFPIRAVNRFQGGFWLPRCLPARTLAQLVTAVLLAAAVLVGGTPARAQDNTPPPAPTADPAALATQAAADVALAEDLNNRADTALGYAYDLFGLFEGITAIIGLAIPVIIGVGGFIGFRRILQAEGEVKGAQQRLDSVRERFEQEMQARQRELDALQKQLLVVAEEQRQRSARATLAQALLPIGERQYRAKDFTGAINTYQRALELDLDNPNTHYRLGYVYVQSGMLDKAESHLQRALEIDTQFAPALATLGYVYRRIGEKMDEGMERSQILNRAESYLLEALKISPRLVDDDGESWWGSLGGLYRRRGQVDQAIHAYDQASTVTPQSSYPFSNLALLYVQKRDRAGMLRTYKRVEQLALAEVQADVDNYWAYSDLLTSRMALGKYADAELTLEQVFDTTPKDSPYVLDMLVDTLSRLKEALDGDATNEGKQINSVIARIREFQGSTPKRVTGEHEAVSDDSGGDDNNGDKAAPGSEDGKASNGTGGGETADGGGSAPV